jgi:pimeloyl-ACP methyl ester carboxylesterase
VNATRNEERITFDDGVQTTLERWGRSGPIILAVHGMTSSRRSWDRLARHLDGRFRVVAYDQRGHGDCAGVTGPMSLERGVRDFVNVAETIGEPIDVALGHSWGGAVVIAGGTRYPVARLAAIDPMIRQVANEWYEEYFVELRELFTLTGEARDAKTRADYADWDPVDVEGKVHAVHSMTVAPIEGLMRENPPELWDLRATIATYGKPLLLVMAGPDEGINSTQTLDDVQREHSANVDIETFAGAGHNVHRTAFNALTKTLDDWLART